MDLSSLFDMCDVTSICRVSGAAEQHEMMFIGHASQEMCVAVKTASTICWMKFPVLQNYSPSPEEIR